VAATAACQNCGTMTAPAHPRQAQATDTRRSLAERQRFWWWVAGSALAIVLFSVAVPVSATLYRLPVLAAFVVGILQSGSIPLALVAPRWAVAAWAVGNTVFIVFGTAVAGAPWPLSATGVLSLCALLLVIGTRQPVVLGVVAWAVGIAASLQVLLYVGFGESKMASTDGIVANLVTTTALTALALLVGILVAQRRHARGELAAEQDRRMLVEERNRIARELHDVVAHSMSVIQVQASSAPYRISDLDEQARGEFADIAASARSAMQEMRRLLGVLRSDGSAAEGMPQPGIARVAELVPAVERTGIVVTVDLDPALPADGVASVAAYRIAQESLSNVVRHAPGARASLRAEVVDGAILLSVENGAPEPGTSDERPRQPGDGHGIIGMRERASILGGSLYAGPAADGGYRVLAVLPIAASATIRHDEDADRP
jgi:signal transduction histidine kinase